MDSFPRLPMKSIFPTLALAAALLVSAQAQAPKPPDDTPSPVYTLTPDERVAGWRLLFDGQNNHGLRGLTYNDFINRGWKINHGTLFCEKTIKQMGLVTGGHLITADQFDDFEFSWEWKLSVSGKSGIMYLVSGTRQEPVGFTYSIIDDTHHPDGQKGGPIRQSGALYNLIPAPDLKEKKLEEPGQWNKGRILVQGNHIEHWLNGVKVVEFDLGSPQLQQAIAKATTAKLIKPTPTFGRKFKTALVILDEGEEVEFRNLRVRPIFGATGAPSTFVPVPK
jgi:hypothetical protein